MRDNLMTNTINNRPTKIPFFNTSLKYTLILGISNPLKIARKVLVNTENGNASEKNLIVKLNLSLLKKIAILSEYMNMRAATIIPDIADMIRDELTMLLTFPVLRKYAICLGVPSSNPRSESTKAILNTTDAKEYIPKSDILTDLAIKTFDSNRKHNPITEPKNTIPAPLKIL